MSACVTETFDAAQADLILRTAHYELQRNKSESTILRYMGEMRAGRFIQGTSVHIAVLPDQSGKLVDGYHRLEATKRSGVPTEFTRVSHDVQNETEVAELYSRFDQHKPRSWNDALRAYRAGDMLCDNKKWTSMYAAALGFLFERFKVARTDKENELARIQALRSRDVRVQAMNESLIPATHYVQAIGASADIRYYQRATVMAVGIEIFRYDAPHAHQFFSTLAADSGLVVGQPQRALLRYLREHHASGAVAREAQAKAVAIAWNAFAANDFKGRELTSIKPESMKQFRIVGTPWVEKDFDPIRRYLPDLFRQSELPLAEPEAEQPAKPRRGRRMVSGVNAATMEPVTIFEREPALEPVE